MTTNTFKTGLVLAAFMAMAMDAPLVFADAQTPLQRPLLENYSDYNQFLIDMAAYKKHLREQQAAEQQQNQQNAETGSSGETATPAAETAAGEAPATANPADSESESAPPPLIVNGPEDLDSAVEAAKSFPHPVYQTPRRYNRSTAESFHLPPLNPEDLEGSAISGMWLGDNVLPDDVMTLDANALDAESTIDDQLKQIYRKIFAAQKADDDSDQQQATETLVKDLGQSPRIATVPQLQVAYPFSSDGSGSISGLTRNSGTTAVFTHGETN